MPELRVDTLLPDPLPTKPRLSMNESSAPQPQAPSICALVTRVLDEGSADY
jgi:hypothetical protein